MPCVYVSMVSRQVPPSLFPAHVQDAIWFKSRIEPLSTVGKSPSPAGLACLSLHSLFIFEFLTSFH